MAFCRVDGYIYTEVSGKYAVSGISNVEVIFHSIELRGLRNIIVDAHDSIRKIGKNYG